MKPFLSIFLDGPWQLSCPARKIRNVPMNVPGDVHSSLLADKRIDDPFFDCNEKKSEWVHLETWHLRKEFELKDFSGFSAVNLVLGKVDTFASVSINSHAACLEATNMFRAYTVNIKKYLRNGKNTIQVVFSPACKRAEELNRTLPNDVPWSEGNNQVAHMNLIRKPQFHSGWDWGPYIIPIGIYEKVRIEMIYDVEMKGIKVYQTNVSNDLADVRFEVYTQNYKAATKEMTVSFAGETKYVQISDEITNVSFHVTNPRLWYTFDYGEPFLYEVVCTYNGQTLKKKIGIRDLRLVNEKDKHGVSFSFVLNTIPIFARGTNIIPLDALPERETEEKMRAMLMNAKDANMNMIRVWGGGYFFNDYFYEICDELGILVWHDLMFACAQYPTTKWFFDEVSHELVDQTLRLQSHPSIALWCGDNEIWQTINWSAGTKDNKEFYREEYSKLNQFLKGTIEKLDSTRRFWLGSPSRGVDDYQGTFLNMSEGDSHYWEVWHGNLTFAGYLATSPRFCSEFGFQSYPSLPVVRTFTPPGTNDLASPAFDAHQKNKKGNAKIASMFDYYFRKPETFKDTLYLSQVQQAVAIKTATEHWRQIKDICSGVLFWQLNDCWPVSSWSSVEYGGRWKQLMYHAKHFFEPQTISFENHPMHYNLFFINDLPTSLEVRYHVKWFDWNGVMMYGKTGTADIKGGEATIIWQMHKWQVAGNPTSGFLYATATFLDKEVTNFMFLDAYKNCPFASDPNIKTKIVAENGKTTITLTTDKPAFFVHLEHENVTKFSDSSFVLLPDESKVVTCDHEIDRIDVYHLK